MRYILPTGSLSSLTFLRDQYQDERHVDISQKPSSFGLPTFLGGTNIAARSSQIQFLEKIRLVLEPNIIKEEKIQSEEERLANLTAACIMIAACLYVQSQIPSRKNNSALHRLINKNLGITNENYLDDEDKDTCYLATQRVLHHSPAAFEEANVLLAKKGQAPFSEQEWSSFSNFIKEQQCLKAKQSDYLNQYPITSFTRPFFGATFGYIGATAGYLAGDVLASSSKAIPAKLQLTACVGSTLFMIGSGPLGVACSSSVIAGKIATTLCQISLSRILEAVMGLLGQAVGVGVGLPLDTACHLMWRTCALISTYYKNIPNAKLTGMRICDGRIVVDGEIRDENKIEIVPVESESGAYKSVVVNLLKEDGTLDPQMTIPLPEGGIYIDVEQIARAIDRELERRKQSEQEGVVFEELDTAKYSGEVVSSQLLEAMDSELPNTEQEENGLLSMSM